MNQVFLIGLYLAAIVAANLSIAYYGPQATIVNAFLFIGLDLVTRDALHEVWRGRSLWLRMGALIAAGSLLSYALNQDAAHIARASFSSFLWMTTADMTVYHTLKHRPWMVRSNGSNLVGALVDSIAFPILAFGGLPLGIMAGQFVAKVAGGLVWSWLLGRARPAVATA